MSARFTSLASASRWRDRNWQCALNAGLLVTPQRIGAMIMMPIAGRIVFARAMVHGVLAATPLPDTPDLPAYRDAWPS